MNKVRFPWFSFLMLFLILSFLNPVLLEGLFMLFAVFGIVYGLFVAIGLTIK